METVLFFFDLNKTNDCLFFFCLIPSDYDRIYLKSFQKALKKNEMK